MRGRTSAECNCSRKTERQDTGRDLNHMQFLMAAPFKPQGPQKQGLGHWGHVLHTSLLHRRARWLLLALCKGHRTASSYSTQPIERTPTGALSAWECRWEHRRLSECVCIAKLKWACRETAAKVSKLPAARRHPKGTYPVLHQL